MMITRNENSELRKNPPSLAINASGHPASAGREAIKTTMKMNQERLDPAHDPLLHSQGVSRTAILHLRSKRCACPNLKRSSPRRKNPPLRLEEESHPDEASGFGGHPSSSAIARMTRSPLAIALIRITRRQSQALSCLRKRG